MKKTLRFVVLLCLTIAQPACAWPRTYSADRIDARVIDAATKQPLEGVIVVAHWELRSTGYNPGGSVPIGQMRTMEAITDKEGKFHFPAWGPLVAWKGQMHDDDPQLIFFKSGYTRLILSNEDKFTLESVRRSHRTSDWNGKTIELKPFKGTREEYAEHLSPLHASIRSILVGGECEWKHIPRLSVAIHKQKALFRKERILSSLYSIEDLPNKSCGSPKEFFKEHLQ